MRTTFEETLIAHCAATLAGHKAGSLFSYRLCPRESPEQYLASLAPLLTAKGVEVRLLKRCQDGCLVYVYRPGMLAGILREKDTADFLHTLGYSPCDLDGCFRMLSERIRCGEDFPHEIGIFLAYPLEDVIGFIKNHGDNYCCLGCWKAYGNAEAAERRFNLYRKCRRIYLSCYRRGFSLSRLTVAA